MTKYTESVLIFILAVLLVARTADAETVPVSGLKVPDKNPVAEAPKPRPRVPVPEFSELPKYLECVHEINECMGGLDLLVSDGDFRSGNQWRPVTAFVGNRGTEKGLFWYGSPNRVFFVPFGKEVTSTKSVLTWSQSKGMQSHNRRLYGHVVRTSVPDEGEITITCTTFGGDYLPSEEGKPEEPKSRNLLNCDVTRGRLTDLTWDPPIDPAPVIAYEFTDRKGRDALVAELESGASKNLASLKPDSDLQIENYLNWTLRSYVRSYREATDSEIDIKAFLPHFQKFEEVLKEVEKAPSLKIFARRASRRQSPPTTLILDPDTKLATALWPLVARSTDDQIDDLVDMLDDRENGQLRYLQFLRSNLKPTVTNNRQKAFAALIWRYDDARKSLAACANLDGLEKTRLFATRMTEALTEIGEFIERVKKEAQGVH